MSGDTDIAKAEMEAAVRRQRLLATADKLKERLKPAALAHDAADKLKSTGENAAHAGIDLVKRQPIAAAGVVAGLAAFFARKPIARLFRRRAKTPNTEI